MQLLSSNVKNPRPQLGSAWCWGGNGSNLSPNRVLAEDVKSCIHYHAQLWLPDKGRAIGRLSAINSWDLEPLHLLNSLALKKREK